MRPLPVNRFYKGVGAETARPFPRFKPALLIRDKVAAAHQFIPFQTSKVWRNTGGHGHPGFYETGTVGSHGFNKDCFH